MHASWLQRVDEVNEADNANSRLVQAFDVALNKLVVGSQSQIFLKGS